MTKHFGELARVYGIVTRSVSPYEQKIFKGFFKHLLKDYERRVIDYSYTIVPRKSQ